MIILSKQSWAKHFIFENHIQYHIHGSCDINICFSSSLVSFDKVWEDSIGLVVVVQGVSVPGTTTCSQTLTESHQDLGLGQLQVPCVASVSLPKSEDSDCSGPGHDGSPRSPPPDLRLTDLHRVPVKNVHCHWGLFVIFGRRLWHRIIINSKRDRSEGYGLNISPLCSPSQFWPSIGISKLLWNVWHQSYRHDDISSIVINAFSPVTMSTTIHFIVKKFVTWTTHLDRKTLPQSIHRTYSLKTPLLHNLLCTYRTKHSVHYKLH